jgi:hypothetical protein
MDLQREIVYINNDIGVNIDAENRLNNFYFSVS